MEKKTKVAVVVAFVILIAVAWTLKPTSLTMFPSSDGGFETGDFSNYSDRQTTFGALSISTFAYEGQYSGQFTTEPTISTARSRVQINTDPNDIEVYARGYFYIAQGLPLPLDHDRFYIMRFEDTSTFRHTVTLGIFREGGVDVWRLHLRGPPIIDENGTVTDDYVFYQPIGNQVPSNTWVCVELRWSKGVTGGAQVWIDGQLEFSVMGVDTFYHSTVKVYFGITDKMYAGLDAYWGTGSTYPVEVYADCLAIDTKYIGPEGAETYLDLKSYVDNQEVSGFAQISGVDTFTLPQVVQVQPGTYTITCTYEGVTKQVTVVVSTGETKEVIFQFGAQPTEEAWYVWIAAAIIISAGVAVVVVKRKQKK